MLTRTGPSTAFGRQVRPASSRVRVCGGNVPSDGLSVDHAGAGDAPLSDEASWRSFGLSLVPSGAASESGKSHPITPLERAAAMQFAARTLEKVAPTMTDAARRIALAIAWAETRYGVLGSFAPDGVPSNNWGGCVVNPTFLASGGKVLYHPDKDRSGNPTRSPFAAFDTAEEGAAYFLKTWRGYGAEAPASLNDAYGVAAAMYHGPSGRHYYTGTPPKGTPPEAWTDEDRINAYASMIRSVLPQVNTALALPPLPELRHPKPQTPPPTPQSPPTLASVAPSNRGETALKVLGGVVAVGAALYLTAKVQSP